LHDQVEAYLDELRLAGGTDIPTGSGRDLCLKWMRGSRKLDPAWANRRLLLRGRERLSQAVPTSAWLTRMWSISSPRPR